MYGWCLKSSCEDSVMLFQETATWDNMKYDCWTLYRQHSNSAKVNSITILKWMERMLNLHDLVTAVSNKELNSTQIHHCTVLYQNIPLLAQFSPWLFAKSLLICTYARPQTIHCDAHWPSWGTHLDYCMSSLQPGSVTRHITTATDKSL